MKNTLKIIICCALAIAMPFLLIGCGNVDAQHPGKPMSDGRTVSLMADIVTKRASESRPDERFISAQADFAVKLFKAASSGCLEKGENVLASPLSAMLVLAMTANGADNGTLAEMENALGGIPIEKLNEYMLNYLKNLPSDEGSRLNISDSIWFRKGFDVRKEFLQVNADYYNVEAYSSPFDEQTVKDINSLIKESTDGLIDSIIDTIEPDAVMYLINALLLDAEWDVKYTEGDVYDAPFYPNGEFGDTENVKMMRSIEANYLSDGSATGFIKPYKGGKYAFAALLPNEGVELSDYTASLSGEKLLEILNNPIEASVSAGIPKFEYDCSLDLNAPLQSLGMVSAFDGGADFSRLSSDGVYIDTVLQKTYIKVNEIGTRAGAVTGVLMVESAAPLAEYSVVLDRPFLYMIIDTETNIPIFIGAVNSVGN